MPVERVDPGFAEHHLAKAQQFAAAARDAAGRDHWDAAVSNAALAGIAATDAYLVATRGFRSRGGHAEVVKLLREHAGPSASERADTLLKLIRRKSTAQYGDRLSTEAEARDAVLRAERLVSWAKEAMKGAHR